MSTSLSYCADCANLLYPRVDHANHVLLNACRNCPYYEEAQSNLVFRNDLMSVSKEQAGVTDGLAKDPTLRRTAELECPRCGRAEAVTFQDQGKRVANRMILFYVCASCQHTFNAPGITPGQRK